MAALSGCIPSRLSTAPAHGVPRARAIRATGSSIRGRSAPGVSPPLGQRCILSTRRVPYYRGEVDRVTGRYVAGLSWLGLFGRWFFWVIA